ncbi:MAG: N-acetylmuramoyl-L-alanine amidase [Alphaproteobacteria bacterium]
MRKIKQIILHCTATPEGKDFSVATIRHWHRQRGWNDIGYHYLIRLNGQVEKGRDEAIIGAHVKGHNHHSIGIAYVGGVDKNMRPKDTRNPQQKQALGRLVQQLQRKYPQASLHGHYEFANKACPSFIVKAEEFCLKGERK